MGKLIGVWGILWGLFLTAGVGAQQKVPRLEELVSTLVDSSEQYRATLPSLSCDEEIVSQRVKKGTVKQEVRMEGVFQVTRTGDDEDPFKETHQFTQVNGAPPPPHFNIPYFVSGAFANGIGFSRARVNCVDYRMVQAADAKTFILNSTSRSDQAGVPACSRIPPGLKKTSVIDAASVHVRHVEQTMSAEEEKRFKQPSFATVDYGPVELGGETLWLPMKMTAHDAKDEGRMQATYANCRLFHGEIKILPGVGKVPAE